ncbi:MAG: KAP family NTPase, partial [Muribaculaceae bacterium]|nr:KAP family NTPase [Muribaculaceae bacterium]
MTKRLSLSDIPLSETTNDFGTDSYVRGLVKFIENSEAPITIALQGEWGSGKTSLMNSLYKRLCTEGKRFKGININTWEFSMLSTPEETVVKIIAQLVRKLSKDNPKPKHTLEKMLKGGANLLLRTGREWAKGLVPGAGLLIEGVGAPSEFSFDKEKEYEEYTLSDLKRELTEAIKQ